MSGKKKKKWIKGGNPSSLRTLAQTLEPLKHLLLEQSKKEAEKAELLLKQEAADRG